VKRRGAAARARAHATVAGQPRGPVVRLRPVIVCVALVALAIASPLLVVRKQVYLRSLAIEREQLADSLLSADRALARLSVQAQALDATPRIEAAARQYLGMEYPKAEQIVIVGGGRALPPPNAASSRVRLLTLLRRAFGQERG